MIDIRNSIFIELIQIALGSKNTLSHTPTTEEWNELFLLSKKQALLGINYTAIERLPEEQRPPRPIRLKWALATDRIKERNIELNHKVIEISQHFHNDGFPNIILKGQGIAQYYGVKGLDLYRTPGDLDIWFDRSREDIIAYVHKHQPKCDIVYHHVDFPDIDGVQVEIHFTPSWMNCYFTNRHLQKFFQQGRRFDRLAYTPDVMPTPDIHFNRVYILLHIYRHLFHEGIGLRQVMDYYFVLIQGFNEDDRIETMKIINRLKMGRFASAIMWILKDVFCINEQYLITSPNEAEGRFLLEEIMRAGNLGLHDKRISRGRHESDISHGLRKVARNFRFIQKYPSEVMWSPLFKIWHFAWRKRINREVAKL